jgi:peptide chain release factor 1
MESNEQNHLIKKIYRIKERIRELETLMEKPEILKQPEKLTVIIKEHKNLIPIIQKAQIYQELQKKIDEASEILQISKDNELRELAKEDLEENQSIRITLEQELKIMLIPKDPQDKKNAIMEIRAGTGGEEAALFANDLYKMYIKYIEKQGWKTELLNSNPTELGGLKEIIFSITGNDVYGKLKYESGVHRVQRVPTTETSGRIHTSAASVVVLPEAEEVDIDIDTKDIRIDVYRSSGPGGQSVNTTDSAVRITHLPTGIVVTCQDEKSQHKNKAKAIKVLRARLYDKKQEEEDAKLTASRRSMIRTGDRSVKIRTFNYPQSRVTDHRINLTLYKLQEILTGDLGEIIDKLQVTDRNQKLKDEE